MTPRDLPWREERKDLLAKVRRVVVKVGSAVLTSAHGLDLDVVESLASQLCALHDRGVDVVLVSSGAVSAGRGVLRDQTELRGMPDRQAASAIGQSRLMHAYDQAFGRRHKMTAQILLTRDDLRSRRRFLNVRNTFGVLLGWRAVPIVNENDTVAVQELEFGDNDRLAGLLLNVVDADLFVNLTSARGVLGENPDKNPDAACLDCVEDIEGLDIKGLCGGKTQVGSGGMYSKLLSARRASQLGVPTLILSGREPDAINRVFAGQDLGTWVRPQANKISRRKYWMAYNMEPSGALVVDDGAVRALVSGHKSLLPAGIREVEGQFGRGALLHIRDQQGELVAVGLSNYRAVDLRKILGLKSSEIEAVLGPGHYPEAVHRDNMLMRAAL